ncbi:MAG TPA: hypothetical protein EYP89_00735 [Candidatus Omnitrophica bacterium]|nr:hypothetical protein [Candidatus Omnitrophota bacterium]
MKKIGTLNKILLATIFLFTANSVASPLDKKEILSILTKSSKTRILKKKPVRKKHRISPPKTKTESPSLNKNAEAILVSMPKMKNSPYEGKEIKTLVPQKLENPTLETGRLPDIKPNIIREEKIKIYRNEHKAIKKREKQFDSANYLNVLF